MAKKRQKKWVKKGLFWCWFQNLLNIDYYQRINSNSELNLKKKIYNSMFFFLEEHDNGTNIVPVKWFNFFAIYNFENVYKNKQNYY